MRNKVISFRPFLLFFLCSLLFATHPLADATAQTSMPRPSEAHPLLSSRSGMTTLPNEPTESSPNSLTSRADLIAFGRVLKTESFWSADGDQIESATTIEVTRRLKGDAGQQIVIYTIGGYIAEEDLGMMSPHEASFYRGEEVAIFAESIDDGYRLVQGAAGKYRITGEHFIDHFSARRGSLRALLSELRQLPQDHNHGALAKNSSSSFFVADGLSNLAQQYFVTSGHRKWATTDALVPFYVHINTQQAGQNDGSKTDFLGAILAAAGTWSQVPIANLTFQYAGRTSSTSTSYNGVNEIVFMNKGLGERGAAAQIWYKRDLTLVEADIWINDDYDWNAKGTPDAHELDLQSVLLHEFGHWLVLGHLADADTVMYPKIPAGVVKHQLHQDDEQGISTIYPCKLQGCRSSGE